MPFVEDIRVKRFQMPEGGVVTRSLESVLSHDGGTEQLTAIVVTNLQLVASSRFILLLWTQELLSVLKVFFDNNKQKLNAPVIARLVRQTV
jgi:hypothetical protein